MGIKQYLYSVIIVLVFIVKVIPANASEKKATDVLELFLKKEFNGKGSTRDDSTIVRYNSKLQAEYDNRLGGASIYLIYDSILIINSYNIKSIKCDSKACIADVEYSQLAKTETLNKKRNILIDKRIGVSKFILNKIDGNWYVYEPGLMMTSIDALIKHYEKQVKLEASIDISKDTDNSRKMIFEKNSADLVNLKKLLKESVRVD